MKQDLAPILFYDNDKPAVRAKRTDPVAAAARSNHALTAFSKRANDDYPAHSFTSRLALKHLDGHRHPLDRLLRRGDLVLDFLVQFYV